MKIRYFIFCVFLCFPPAVPAVKYTLTDSRVLEGEHALLSRVNLKISEIDSEGDQGAKMITAIDDRVRITYIPKNRIAKIDEDKNAPAPIRFKTGNKSNFDEAQLRMTGTYDDPVRAPFDKYGRRLLKMYHSGGTDYIEQAITDLTPNYVSVAGLRMNNRLISWDMQISALAIPRDQITPILLNLVDPKNVEDRLKLVRFYFLGNRFTEADEEIQSILEDWKDDENVNERMRPLRYNIRQQKYQTILDELEHRWNAGQYQFVKKYLLALESDDDMPDRMLEPVKRMLQRYDDFDRKHQTIIAELKKLNEGRDKKHSDISLEAVDAMIDEINKGLNVSTLNRLAAYQLYTADAKLSAEEKLALAVTGWYAGADADNSRLGVAAELPETYKLVRRYLDTGADALERQAILNQLKKKETSRPDLIAGVLKTMSYDPPAAQHTQTFVAALASQPLPVQYDVLLPPEYNPNLRYPLIVALNGSGLMPEGELRFWQPQASRNGYIVIAPHWTAMPFTARNHIAVVGSMKDAFRKFSVDTDRVYLTGHGSGGGTAAWDIGLAHPDLWAGVVVFNAVGTQFIDAYRQNVFNVPLYFVFGEFDGFGSQRKWNVNAALFNRYLGRQIAVPPDVTLIRYKGRGEEPFSEEMLFIFDWMSRRKRNFAPIEFETETCRMWDSFFWGVEMNFENEQESAKKSKPQKYTLYEPFDFPDKTMTALNQRIRITSKVQQATNTMRVSISPSVSNVKIYLTPDMLDFKTKAKVELNDRRISPASGIIEADIQVMLDDVRTRGDRQHPFWAVLPAAGSD